MNLKYINPYYTKNKIRTLSVFDTFQTPIFDRKESDIEYLKQLLEKGFKNFTDEEKEIWLNTSLKGALNASDLNRIENNISLIASVLEVSLVCKTNWARTNIPEETDFQRIHDNLKVLYNIIYGENVTKEELEELEEDEEYIFVPDLPFNHYEKLNDIEYILYDMYTILNSQLYSYASTDELYCGE